MKISFILFVLLLAVAVGYPYFNNPSACEKLLSDVRATLASPPEPSVATTPPPVAVTVDPAAESAREASARPYFNMGSLAEAQNVGPPAAPSPGLVVRFSIRLRQE